MLKKLLLTTLLLFIFTMQGALANTCTIIYPKSETFNTIYCSDSIIFFSTTDSFKATKDYRKDAKNITSLEFKKGNVKSAVFCIKPAVYVHEK